MQEAAKSLAGFGLPEDELRELHSALDATARAEVQKAARSAADTVLVRMNQRCVP